MSLRIAPASSHPTSTTNTTTSKLSSSASNSHHPSAPSAPGLPDTLRASLSPLSATSTTPQLASTHPLESRLANWHATQSQLKSTLLQRTYGLAEPLRRGMELKMVRDADAFRPSALGPPAALHDDILSGRDCELTWEDVYAGQDGLRLAEGSGGDGSGVSGAAWTEEMEKKVGMGKW